MLLLGRVPYLKGAINCVHSTCFTTPPNWGTFFFMGLFVRCLLSVSLFVVVIATYGVIDWFLINRVPCGGHYHGVPYWSRIVESPLW